MSHTNAFTAPEKRAIDSAFSALSYLCERFTDCPRLLEGARKDTRADLRKGNFGDAPGYADTLAKALCLVWFAESESLMQGSGFSVFRGLTSIRPEAYAMACVYSRVKLRSPSSDCERAALAKLADLMPAALAAKDAEHSRLVARIIPAGK
jgi:hypothetical protein